MRIGVIVSFMLVPLCALPLTYCGKSDGGGSSKKKRDEPPPAGTLALDGLNGTIPKDVAVSSPTDTVSTANLATMRSAGVLTLPANGLTEPQPPVGGGASPTSYDYLSKAAKLKAVLTATTLEACAAAIPSEMNLAQGNIAHASCFGPTTRFTTHPDQPGPYNDPGADGKLLVGDTGLMFDYADMASSGQACSAQVVNNAMHNVGTYADTAIGMQALVACAGRLAAVERPIAGETKDMIGYLSGLSTTGKPYTITAASMEATTSGAKTIYITRISGTVSDNPRNILNRDFTLSVYHVPQDSNAETYKGVAQFMVEDFDPITPNNSGKDAYISLAYDWTGSALNYRYRQVMKTAADGTFSDTTKELAVPTTETPSTWTEITVQNDAYGFGKLAFTWRTGDMLVFNATTSRDGTATTYFGHKAGSSDLPGSTTFQTAAGMKCYSRNPAPNGANAFKDYVQQQTMTLNTTTGIWEMATSNISYAPTLSCDLAAGYSFDVFQEGLNSWSTHPGPLTNNLIPLTTYQSSWSQPSAPQVF
jgi:hypothetical protein